MWLVILFLIVAGSAYFIMTVIAGIGGRNNRAVPPRNETAKEWASRVHGLRFDEERRRRSGLPPLRAKDQINVRLAKYGLRMDTDTDISTADLAEYERRLAEDEAREKLAEIADWRATLREVNFDGVAGADFVIRYKGDLTDRPITVQSVMEGDHAFYLDSFCELRGAKRMFRVDEIDQIVTASGEVFDGGMKWLHSLSAAP